MPWRNYDLVHGLSQVWVTRPASASPPSARAAGPPMTYATRGSRSQRDVRSGPQARDQRHGACAPVTPRAAPASVRAGYRCGHSRKTVATQRGLPFAPAYMAFTRPAAQARGPQTPLGRGQASSPTNRATRSAARSMGAAPAALAASTVIGASVTGTP